MHFKSNHFLESQCSMWKTAVCWEEHWCWQPHPLPCGHQVPRGLKQSAQSCPRSVQSHTVCDGPRWLTLSPSLSFLVSLSFSGTRNSLGILILLSRLRCDSLNQDKGSVLLDLFQNAVAVSRSYQSNVIAKRQARVQRVLRDSRWSKEWWKLVSSTWKRQRALSPWCIVWVGVYTAPTYQKLCYGGAGLPEMPQAEVGTTHQSLGRVLYACVGTNISSGFIAGKSQGEEQQAKNN